MKNQEIWEAVGSLWNVHPQTARLMFGQAWRIIVQEAFTRGRVVVSGCFSAVKTQITKKADNALDLKYDPMYKVRIYNRTTPKR